MDTRLNVRQCLFGMTFMLIVHHCDLASASSGLLMCPQGQMYHAANIKLGRPYAACCYPTRCGVGEEVKPCTTNGGHDTCQTCGKYFNQSQRTSSFTMNKRCVSWPLDENCEDNTGQLNLSDPKTHRCLCDMERGQRFDKPETSTYAPRIAFCQPFKVKCEPGHEPVINGSCKPCGYGYFKATKGYRLCEPKTDCHLLGLETLSLGRSTADNNCSEPVILTTPKPTVLIVDPGDTGIGGGVVGGGGSGSGSAGQNPPTPTSSAAKTSKSTTTTPLTGSGSSKSVKETGTGGDQEEGNSLLPVILAVVFLLIVIIIVVIFLFYRKHKGMSFCACARFKSSDVEKNSGANAGHGQYKNGTGNGILTEPHLTVVTKGSVNNNINGSLPQHQYQQNSTNHRHNPHAHHNGNSVHFSDSSDLDSQIFQNQANSSHQNRMSPAPRHGILRNGRSSSTSDPHPTYSQFCHSRSQEASIDSIGREKLRVNGFEANQDLGENDPLLVAEGPVPPRSVAVSGGSGGHNLLHNSAFAASNSPPRNMSPISPGIYTSASGGLAGHPSNMQNPPMMGNMNTNFNMVTTSSPSTVPIQTSQSQQPTHQVTFVPAADTATFKRSISVIASPEGEVEEEELEANVPRFSQILPDGSEEPPPSVNEPPNANPILRMLQEKERVESQQQQQAHPMDSPQREMTHQMRLPSERLQHRPHHQNPVSNATQQRNPNYPHHHNHHGGYPPPALFRASSQPADNNIPDHCIMNLKEQQLANSFHSSLEDSSSAGMRSDVSTTGVFKLEDFTAWQDQTNLKVCPGDSANKNGAKSNNSSKLPEFGMFVIGSGGGSAQNTLERKRSAGSNSSQRRRFLSGSGRQNSVERKRRSSGSESTQNTLEFKRGVDKQRSCIKFNSNGLEEGETEEKKMCLGRTVSFDSEEKSSGVDYLGHETKPKQVGGNSLTSTSSSSDGSQGPYLDTSVDLGKDVQPSQRVMEEGGYEGENESDCEDNTNQKQRQPEDSLDLSSSEDGGTSHATNTYRRCQSESASGSTDTVQKPPPRSLSEEKPLKMERPIAKVKPMPASDLSVNKLVPDEEGGASSSSATTTTTTTSSGASGNILDYSSDSSSGEENVSSESPRPEENRQEESDSTEGDGRL